MSVPPVGMVCSSWGGVQRDSGDAAKAVLAGFLSLPVALEFGPIDLIGLVGHSDDVVDLDGDRRRLRPLERRVAAEPIVDLLRSRIGGSQQRIGPVDVLLLHDCIGRHGTEVCDEGAERRAHHPRIRIFDLLRIARARGRAELVDLDDVGNELDLRALEQRISEADHGHDHGDDPDGAPRRGRLHIGAVALVPFLTRGEIGIVGRIRRSHSRKHLHSPSIGSCRSGLSGRFLLGDPLIELGVG